MALAFSLLAVAAGETYCPGLGDFDVAWGNVQGEGNSGWRVNGEGGVHGRTSFNLLGGYIEFDYDACGGVGGINNNFYTVSPDGGMGSGYCDIQSNDSPICMELDIDENNGNQNGRTTWHTWGNEDGGCDQDGCYADFNIAGDCQYHMRTEFAADGGITQYRNGAVLNVNQHGSLGSAEKNQIVQTMNNQGAAIISTQWSGWVPGVGASRGHKNKTSNPSLKDANDCSFAITNVVVHAPQGIRYGPAPPTCNPPTPGPPTPTPPPGQCQLFPGKNNDGTNLKGGSASSADDCCNQCSATSGCAGFTFVHENNECWLKSSVDSPRDDECGGCVTSGTVSTPAPTPTPVPVPAPSPSPVPSPVPTPSGGCPGGSLKACVQACPSTSATVFQVCVAECSKRCGDGDSCTGGDDGTDLASCMGSCPADKYSDCVTCCSDKFPSWI